MSTESCTSGAQGPEASGRRGSGALTIVVKGNNWGEGKPENIQVLLDNVASHFTRHLREGLSETIEIWNSSKGPMILWRLPGRTKYAILLNTIGTRWAQYGYQFAHEFCHLLSGYDRLKGSANSWFHESVCEAASFFALRSMGVTWRDAPPYPNWRSYAQHLTSYAKLQASKVEPGLPVGSPPGVWLRAHEAQGRRDPTRREANRLVALRMLPVFEHDPTGWNAVRNLPASDASIEQYLAEWKVAAHACDREFVARIEGALGIRSPENSD